MPARQDLLQQGAREESLYLIARGKVRVLRIEEDREVELAILGVGDFVGEGGFLRGASCDATYRALTPCAIYELKRRDLKDLQATCPGLLSASEQAIEQRDWNT